MLFFNIDFLGFRPRFWRVLGAQLEAKLAILASKSDSVASKIRRAARSARRVRPHCMDMCLGSPAWKSLGEAKRFQNQGVSWAMLGPCWLIFRSGAPFFRSRRLLERFLSLFGSRWTFSLRFWSLWTGFCMVWGWFWSLQNYIFSCFLVRASTHRRNALRATKPCYFRCFLTPEHVAHSY